MYIVKHFEVTYPYLKINGKRDINPKSITVLETLLIEIKTILPFIYHTKLMCMEVLLLFSKGKASIQCSKCMGFFLQLGKNVFILISKTFPYKRYEQFDKLNCQNDYFLKK